MPRRIYPLNALRAFEASARHLSFVKASAELSVTPAAVSHQVKKLEEYLGLPLFRRRARGLLLTESGQLLLSELREVFLHFRHMKTWMRRRGDRDRITLGQCSSWFYVIVFVGMVRKMHESYYRMTVQWGQVVNITYSGKPIGRLK